MRTRSPSTAPHPYLEHRDVVAGQFRRPGRAQQQRQEVDGHARGEAHDVRHVEKITRKGAVAGAEGWQDASAADGKGPRTVGGGGVGGGWGGAVADVGLDPLLQHLGARGGGREVRERREGV